MSTKEQILASVEVVRSAVADRPLIPIAGSVSRHLAEALDVLQSTVAAE